MRRVSINPAWSSSKDERVPPTDASADDVTVTSRSGSRDVSRRRDLICLRGVSESRVSVMEESSEEEMELACFSLFM